MSDFDPKEIVNDDDNKKKESSFRDAFYFSADKNDDSFDSNSLKYNSNNIEEDITTDEIKEEAEDDLNDAIEDIEQTQENIFLDRNTEKHMENDVDEINYKYKKLKRKKKELFITLIICAVFFVLGIILIITSLF